MFEKILNIFFPKYCIGCKREGTILCALCERTITIQPRVVGKGLAVLFDYHHPLVKKGLWNLKYRNERAMGNYFGIALYREFFKDMLSQAEHERKPIVLIPIPLSKKRFFERGANHAAVIARAIVRCAQMDNLPITIDEEILIKSRHTKRQVEMPGKKERKENLIGAFSVKYPKRITGKNIIIVDDIITTTATMNEVRKTLGVYKPKHVLGIAVAH